MTRAELEADARTVRAEGRALFTARMERSAHEAARTVYEGLPWQDPRPPVRCAHIGPDMDAYYGVGKR